MTFDYKTFFIGVLVGLLIMIFRNFFVHTSYFDAAVFEGKSVEEASAHFEKLLSESAQNLQNNSELAISEGRPEDAKKLALQAQKYQQDLSLAYNTYIVSKTPASAPTPGAPAPEVMMQAPAPEVMQAPAPEVMAPAPEVMQAPMVSTFEPEPYY